MLQGKTVIIDFRPLKTPMSFRSSLDTDLQAMLSNRAHDLVASIARACCWSEACVIIRSSVYNVRSVTPSGESLQGSLQQDVGSREDSPLITDASCAIMGTTGLAD